MTERDKTSGTQSLSRGLELLRIVARHHDKGIRLRDILQQTDMQRSTAHRILGRLSDERFVAFDPATKIYRLGISAMQIGMEASQSPPLVDASMDAMKHLARQTGDTVFLIVKQGDYALCLHREEGDYPVKITTTYVGGTRILGFGAAGTALLAAMPDDDISALYQRRRITFRKAGIEEKQLLAIIDKTREDGFSYVSDIVTLGVTGIGTLIPTDSAAFAALSVGSITQRLGQSRIASVRDMLQDAARQIASEFHI